MKKLALMCVLGIFTISAFAQKTGKKPAAKKVEEPQLNVEYTTASGLKYKITQKGTGIKAEKGSTVAVHYVGTLLNGTKFDSSRDRGQPYAFKLGKRLVIPGWEEGIALLHVGDKAILTVPPQLGYGERGGGPIPPNSTLIFEVELMNATAPVKPWDLKGKQDTIKTESGLKYIIVQRGADANAAQAAAGKTVSVHYTGFLRNNSEVFDSSVERGEPIQFPLGNGMVIKGWEEGIALMKVGDKFRLIIPSNLAYGEEGRGGAGIPSNADLIFDCELMNVQ